MDLQKISQVKDHMESMYDSIYDLQEAIIEENESKKHEISVTFKAKARDLYLTLIKASITDKEALNLHYTNVSMLILEEEVEKSCGLKISDLKTKSQKRIYVLPRQVHMTLMNVTFGLSLEESGNYYDKDHVTVMHSKKNIKNLYQTDKHFRGKYKNVIDHCIRFDLSRKSTKTQDFLNEL